MSRRRANETEQLTGLVENLETRLAIVEATLAEQAPPAFRGASSVASIVIDAAELLQLRPQDILSDQRAKHLAHARFAVAWVAREATPYSYPRIAGALRRADHSTVINAVRRANQLRESDATFKELTDRLLAAAVKRSPK